MHHPDVSVLSIESLGVKLWKNFTQIKSIIKVSVLSIESLGVKRAKVESSFEDYFVSVLSIESLGVKQLSLSQLTKK